MDSHAINYIKWHITLKKVCICYNGTTAVNIPAHSSVQWHATCFHLFPSSGSQVWTVTWTINYSTTSSHNNSWNSLSVCYVEQHQCQRLEADSGNHKGDALPSSFCFSLSLSSARTNTAGFWCTTVSPLSGWIRHTHRGWLSHLDRPPPCASRTRGCGGMRRCGQRVGDRLRQEKGI